jgi:hypothetical protein
MNEALDEEFNVDGVELSAAELVTSRKREGGSMSKRMPDDSPGTKGALLKLGRLLVFMDEGCCDCGLEAGLDCGCCRGRWGRRGRQTGKFARCGAVVGSHEASLPSTPRAGCRSLAEVGIAGVAAVPV